MGKVCLLNMMLGDKDWQDRCELFSNPRFRLRQRRNRTGLVFEVTRGRVCVGAQRVEILRDSSYGWIVKHQSYRKARSFDLIRQNLSESNSAARI
jgi:hypothetical protein